MNEEVVHDEVVEGVFIRRNLLPQHEHDALLEWSCDNINLAVPGQIGSPNIDGVRVDAGYRRAYVIPAPRRYNPQLSSVLRKIIALVDYANDRIASEGFAVQRFKVAYAADNLTMSHDGCFFGEHVDQEAGSSTTWHRRLTFVYYLQHSPRRYEGGELVFPSSGFEYTPEANALLMFNPALPHRVLHVRVPVSAPDVSGRVDSGSVLPDPHDGRWTYNGWLSRNG